MRLRLVRILAGGCWRTLGVLWARDGSLTFDLEPVPLSQIEAAWQRTDLLGKRLVVQP